VTASFLVLLSAYSQDPSTDFYDQCVKWRLFAQECPILGFKKQNFTFLPHFAPKNANLWPIFGGT